MNKYPVRKYLGKFVAWDTRVHGKASSKIKESQIESFFGMFPQACGLTQFTVADVADYITLLKEQGCSPKHIERKLRAINSFYIFLIEHEHLTLWNIAKPHLGTIWTPSPKAKRRTISLVDFKRVMESAGPVIQASLVAGMLGLKVARDSSTRETSSLWRRTVARAGIEYCPLSQFKIRLRNGIWRDIVKDYCKQFRNPDTLEPKTPSSFAGAVESSTTEVGSTVGYHDYDAFGILGISEFENCPEFQCGTRNSKEAVMEN